jgi:hypothetical protein
MDLAIFASMARTLTHKLPELNSHVSAAFLEHLTRFRL